MLLRKELMLLTLLLTLAVTVYCSKIQMHESNLENLYPSLFDLMRNTEVEFKEDSRELKPVPPVCSRNLVWKSAGGKVLLNDVPFLIKGANWSGFETETNVVHGLWGKATTMDTVLAFCKLIKINALRIPISLDLALNPATKVSIDDCVECKGKTSWEMLDILFDKAAAQGILILLDMHRLNNIKTSPLWVDRHHTENHFIKGWVDILKAFGAKPNLLGIDLYNEPHGSASWGLGLATDWNAAAERIVPIIMELVPTYNKLIFIEGVSTGLAPLYYDYTDPAFDKFMGQNLDGVLTFPIDFGTPELNELLVYSPHVYGPSVFLQDYFLDPTFPLNMPAIWDKQIGFLTGITERAVVVGEWGGTCVGIDAVWYEAWVQYMSAKCLTNSFFWALNPESSDTGGVFKADWVTPVKQKILFMNDVQPNPSVFTTSLLGRTICLDYGIPPVGCDVLTTPLPTIPPVVPEQNPIVPTQPVVPLPPPVVTPDGCALEYAQCAGLEFGKALCCPVGFQCVGANEHYSQCVPVV